MPRTIDYGYQRRGTAGRLSMMRSRRGSTIDRSAAAGNVTSSKRKDYYTSQDGRVIANNDSSHDRTSASNSLEIGRVVSSSFHFDIDEEYELIKEQKEGLEQEVAGLKAQYQKLEETIGKQKSEATRQQQDDCKVLEEVKRKAESYNQQNTELRRKHDEMQLKMDEKEKQLSDLKEVHQQVILLLRQDYEQQIKALKKRNSNDIERMKEIHDKEIRNLRDQLNHLQEQQAEQQQQQQQQQQKKRTQTNSKIQKDDSNESIDAADVAENRTAKKKEDQQPLPIDQRASKAHGIELEQQHLRMVDKSRHRDEEAVENSDTGDDDCAHDQSLLLTQSRESSWDYDDHRRLHEQAGIVASSSFSYEFQEIKPPESPNYTDDEEDSDALPSKNDRKATVFRCDSNSAGMAAPTASASTNQASIHQNTSRPSRHQNKHDERKMQHQQQGRQSNEVQKLIASNALFHDTGSVLVSSRRASRNHKSPARSSSRGSNHVCQSDEMLLPIESTRAAITTTASQSSASEPKTIRQHDYLHHRRGRSQLTASVLLTQSSNSESSPAKQSVLAPGPSSHVREPHKQQKKSPASSLPSPRKRQPSDLRYSKGVSMPSHGIKEFVMDSLANVTSIEASSTSPSRRIQHETARNTYRVDSLGDSLAQSVTSVARTTQRSAGRIKRKDQSPPRKERDAKRLKKPTPSPKRIQHFDFTDSSSDDYDLKH